jgi:hypothetical protein
MHNNVNIFIDPLPRTIYVYTDKYNIPTYTEKEILVLF